MQPHEDKKPFYRVTVDVSPDLHGQLKELSETKNKSQSDILRQSINLMYTTVFNKKTRLTRVTGDEVD